MRKQISLGLTILVLLGGFAYADNSVTFSAYVDTNNQIWVTVNNYKQGTDIQVTSWNVSFYDSWGYFLYSENVPCSYNCTVQYGTWRDFGPTSAPSNAATYSVTNVFFR